MSYFRLGLLRIELKAPVARHTNRVYGIAFVAFRATISLLAIVKHPSPITAWARAACCYGRPMEPLEAVRLLELGVRLPNEVSFGVSERILPLAVLVGYVVWTRPANRILMPAPGVSQDYTLPSAVEEHPDQIPYSRIPVIASAVASKKVLENWELFT